MKTYETKTVPAVPAKEVQVCTGRTCDLCGKKAWSGDDWKPGCYDVLETDVTVTVKKREGVNYPEHHDVEEWDIDLCPDCFETKLVPWLQSQGAKIEKKEESW